MYKRRARVLFVGAGNSCCTQMAEGWVKHLGGSWLEARSAGIEAHALNVRAIAVMLEAGVDISHQESTRLIDELLDWADLVVTVCDVADTRCSSLPHGTQRKHWSLADPSTVRGNDIEITRAFRDVRDDVRRRVEGMIGGMKMLARSSENED